LVLVKFKKQTIEKTKGAIKNGQFRETGNIGYTRVDTEQWTIQRNWEHWVHKSRHRKKTKNVTQKTK